MPAGIGYRDVGGGGVLAALLGNSSQVDMAHRAQPVGPDVAGMNFAEQQQFAQTNPEAWATYLMANERAIQAPQRPQQVPQEAASQMVDTNPIVALGRMAEGTSALQQPDFADADEGFITRMLQRLLRRE